MAEILKITTPLVNKNQVQPNKQVADPNIPFNLQETTKVGRPNPQSDLLKQNNGMIQKEETPDILLNLMKDPSVTVGFLKNIFMLQEIIRLLPVNNQTMTEEIEQLFDSLMVKPEDIALEMMRQENTSTKFKGELFDFLRKLVLENPQPEVRKGVAILLKAINGMTGKQDVMGAVGNSLLFLSESTLPSRGLSEKLLNLAQLFHEEEAPEQFNQLKAQVFELLEEVENSILLSPKMSKVMSIAIYNLSRFNDNPDFLQDATANLLTLIDGRQKKSEFVERVRGFLDELRSPEKAESSKIMDVLAKIIGKQAEDETITLINPEKIEKIIHSLLSSPCNFTPLLHFVVPVEFMDIKSFAELWIDPNAEEPGKEGQGRQVGGNIHMLIVFDIEGIGQFEAELYVVEEKITLSLLCPPAYTEEFSKVSGSFEKCLAGYSYRFEEMKIGSLERPRSLMDVFKTLPHKRTGVDVKV